jgi:hypothetical protein
MSHSHTHTQKDRITKQRITIQLALKTHNMDIETSTRIGNCNQPDEHNRTRIYETVNKRGKNGTLLRT